VLWLRRLSIKLNLRKTIDSIRKEELMEAVIKSERSYAEIMAFIKSSGTQEE